ncbi:M-phase phosphoprotein 6 [Orchesella cincta]|uniref:M-phase phosphoprotein 6 n=1 Tax=Orchesella cincta TaxID=48709 RepID=A0A1D2NCP3_ORCCI|nr:M-phase phosphoprotein 6 [Orchesella cincta]
MFTMSGIGAKLSRHVLGMKFMRKTKDQIDKERVEKVHREHFAPAESETSASVKGDAASSGFNKTPGIASRKNEPTTSKSSLTVEELWSYNQCERYIFGRQSFGGFNPVVENNVKKGIWKPFYLEESECQQDDSEEEEGIKKNQSDVDVSDEEMSKTYGSLIGTLAKRFTRKNKQGAGGKGKNRGNEADNSGQNGGKKPNKRGRFRKNKKEAGGSGDHNNQSSHQQQNRGWGSKGSKKRQRESTGSTNYEYQEERNSRPKRRSDDRNQDSGIPQKKRKFLKPSDD